LKVRVIGAITVAEIAPARHRPSVDTTLEHHPSCRLKYLVRFMTTIDLVIVIGEAL
jgi:hypothetical protein